MNILEALKSEASKLQEHLDTLNSAIKMLGGKNRRQLLLKSIPLQKKLFFVAGATWTTPTMKCGIWPQRSMFTASDSLFFTRAPSDEL